jgi:SNF2 family DNA or RNA helicase
LTIKLLPFQEADVKKLTNSGLPYALIMNDMGTGKTFEASAIDVSLKTSKPTLVVAPLSVLSHWEDHFKLITPNVRRIDPKKRELFLKQDAEVYIMHWDALRLMPELAKVKWGHVIADECHRAQNKKAAQTIALKKLQAEFRTAMSGTPYTTTPDKLWSILNWLDKREYRAYGRFRKEFILWAEDRYGYVKILKPNEAEALGRGPEQRYKEKKLQQRIAPFSVRHLKEEVTPDLPEKYYSTIQVELAPAQRRAYESMKKQMLSWIGEHEDQPLTSSIVVVQHQRMQQFADACMTMRNGKAFMMHPSAKIDAAIELIMDHPDEQFVFFSQFSQMINLFDNALAAKGISHSKLTGETPQKLRGGLVRRFQEGETRIFSSTIKAGGVGITLTSANKVAFFDRQHPPAANEQAEDRLHRIGQKNAVQVIDFMARDTIDRTRKDQLEISWAWFRRVLAPEHFS